MKDLQENKLSMEASHENVKLKDKVTEELNQKKDLHDNMKENSKKDESKKVANAQQDQEVVAGEAPG